MICAIEIGTSRTRVRFVDKNDEIIAGSVQPIGARDVAMSGTNDDLKQRIHEMVEDLLVQQKCQRSDIEDVVAHGMVTADIGLYKVEHAPSPVDIYKLTSHTLRVDIPEISEKPILLIPGVKNSVKDVCIDTLDDIDFMRGEETQIMGILHSPELSGTLKLPFFFLMLSSFTKLVLVNTKKQIDIATTNVTGQLFPAIIKDTFLAGMLPDYFPGPETMNEDLVYKGYQYADKVGFPRALMLIRLSQYFLQMNKEDAMSFLEGIIAYLDLSKMADKLRAYPDLKIIIAGDTYRRKVYTFLFKKCFGFDDNIICLDDDQMQRITVKGAMEILRRARSIEKK